MSQKNTADTKAHTKKGKDIKLSKERVHSLGLSLFDGIKVKSQKERKKIMTERHHEYMDMVAQVSGFNKVNPVIWTEALVRNITKDRARIVITETLRELKSDNMPDSLINRKNIVFYKNAMAYFRNKYGTKKTAGRQVQ